MSEKENPAASRSSGLLSRARTGATAPVAAPASAASAAPKFTPQAPAVKTEGGEGKRSGSGGPGEDRAGAGPGFGRGGWAGRGGPAAGRGGRGGRGGGGRWAGDRDGADAAPAPAAELPEGVARITRPVTGTRASERSDVAASDAGSDIKLEVPPFQGGAGGPGREIHMYGADGKEVPIDDSAAGKLPHRRRAGSDGSTGRRGRGSSTGEDSEGGRGKRKSSMKRDKGAHMSDDDDDDDLLDTAVQVAAVGEPDWPPRFDNSVVRPITLPLSLGAPTRESAAGAAAAARQPSRGRGAAAAAAMAAAEGHSFDAAATLACGNVFVDFDDLRRAEAREARAARREAAEAAAAAGTPAASPTSTSSSRDQPLKGVVRQGQLIHFVLPSVLPIVEHLAPWGLTSSGKGGKHHHSSGGGSDAGGAGGASSSPTPDFDDALADPSKLYRDRAAHIPPGKLGKLRVYASGRVDMEIGGIPFDVTPGVDRAFYEQLGVLMPDDANVADVLGNKAAGVVSTAKIPAVPAPAGLGGEGMQEDGDEPSYGGFSRDSFNSEEEEMTEAFDGSGLVTIAMAAGSLSGGAGGSLGGASGGAGAGPSRGGRSSSASSRRQLAPQEEYAHFVTVGPLHHTVYVAADFGRVEAAEADAAPDWSSLTDEELRRTMDLLAQRQRGAHTRAGGGEAVKNDYAAGVRGAGVGVAAEVAVARAASSGAGKAPTAGVAAASSSSAAAPRPASAGASSSTPAAAPATGGSLRARLGAGGALPAAVAPAGAGGGLRRPAAVAPVAAPRPVAPTAAPAAPVARKDSMSDY